MHKLHSSIIAQHLFNLKPSMLLYIIVPDSKPDEPLLQSLKFNTMATH